LYGVVLRVVVKEGIAEEVLQDVFLRIWDRIDTYDASRGRLFTWMLNIARNLAIDKSRSREISKENKTGGLEKSVHTVERSGFTEQSIDSIGIRERLRTLPDEQRMVVDYLYFKGYTQSELADESGIPLGTIKTRLRTAMQHLRNTLQ
jgi:RNA polymerase sigma factor (sigma-70 family)